MAPGQGADAAPGTALAAVLAAEKLVEHAVNAAEQSLARRIGQGGLQAVLLSLRLLGILAMMAYFVFGGSVLVTRYYLLPHIGAWRADIERAASSAMQAPVTVDRIEADWQGLNPRLRLHQVVLADGGRGAALTLPEVEVVLSWTSLLAWQARLQSLTVIAPQLELRHLADGRWSVAGISIDPNVPAKDHAVVDWLLAQHHISIRDARVHYTDETAASAAPQTPRSGAAAAPATAVDAAAAVVPASWRSLDFTAVNFVLTRGLAGHSVALQLRPPTNLAGHIDVRGDFTHAWRASVDRLTAWRGRLYARLDYADLAQLERLLHVVPADAQISQASGALQAWVDFSGTRIDRLVADVALKDVDAQWRPDLQALRLASLEGRLTQRYWKDHAGETRELAFSALRMELGDGVHLPATDLLLRSTQPNHDAAAAPAEQFVFEASRIVLRDWSQLALELPLPRSWLELIKNTHARGTLEDLHASWSAGAEGTAPAERAPASVASVPAVSVYSLRSRFSGLGVDALAGDAAAAAVDNLAGNMDLNELGGSMQLSCTQSTLRWPALFDGPAWTFDTLEARLRWDRDSEGRLDIKVDALAAANRDIEISASGAYRAAGSSGANGGAASHDAAAMHAAARLDVSGRIVRARVEAVARYVPRITALPAREWLRGALLGGTVSEGRFFLRGDPTQFPFGDARNGEFHATLHVVDGLLDPAPLPTNPVPSAEQARAWRWPKLEGLEADVAFERNLMTVRAQRAQVLGYDLRGITVQLPRIDQPDQHLSIEGQGSGSLADMLRFISASPVAGWTGNFLAQAEVSGSAALKIALDLPLAHPSETTVKGTIDLRSATALLQPRIALLSQINGELGFTQRGISLNDLSAGFLGGEVRINGETQANGSIWIRGKGTATPQGAKHQVDAALLRRILDRTRGSFHYDAALTISHGHLGLQIDTDLVGLAVDLPEPLRKAAAEPRPLHIEAVPVAGGGPARDTVRVSLAGATGALLGIELHRSATTDAQLNIERGVIRVGAGGGVSTSPASKSPLPDQGLLLTIDTPRLDTELWQRLLGIEVPGATTVAPGPGTTAGSDTATHNPNRSDTPVVDAVVLHTGALIVAGTTLNQVALSARREPDLGWSADIEADQAVGSLHWTDAHGAVPAQLSARLSRLAIPEQSLAPAAAESAPSTAAAALPSTDWPSLNLVAEQLEWGKNQLGRLDIEALGAASGHADAWNLQKFILSNSDGKLSASGSWQRAGATPARRMAVTFQLNFNDAGGMLGRFGLPATLRKGSGKLEGELGWRGSPLAIDYPSLAGKLRLSTEKGQFLKADAGAAERLLGVFSLQSLANRVTGDFRDLFGAGFAFDVLTANARIDQGLLTTDDFIMQGVNAVVRVKGSVDLNAETQDLEVVMIPEVNAGTAALGVALVNPAIGLGSFVANFLLRKPLAAAFTKVVHVSGPWQNPRVETLKAEHRTAADAGGGAGGGGGSGGGNP